MSATGRKIAEGSVSFVPAEGQSHQSLNGWFFAMEDANPKAIVAEACEGLVNDLGSDLASVYLFGSLARGDFEPGRSDIDLLLVVDPSMPLVSARDAFRPLWRENAHIWQHGPLVATPADLALHLALFPAFHRVLCRDARCLYGKPVLKDLPPPAPLDPVEEAAYIAARAATYSSVLVPRNIAPARLGHLNRALMQLTKRVTNLEASGTLTALEALLALHARLRELARQMPQFAWCGEPPSGDVPSLLPGCLAFYQREEHLITVLERVDEHTLSDVDWDEVGAAAEEAAAQFALATPWQLRLAASQKWVDALFFGGFDHIWGADILGDLEASHRTLLRNLARSAAEQRVEKLPLAYLVAEEDTISQLIHDTQNALLNAGLRAELFARFTDQEFNLPEWTPPGRETPQHERVAAAWQRWRELMVYYAEMWRGANA
jgi:hypothetical protein